MRKGFATAADVAALVGVSRSAVSRTFTPGAYVSPETRLRVEIAAEQAGYRVNRLAQSLTRDRSNLVGLVVANLDMPFNAALLSHMSQALPASGLQCLLFNAPDASSGIAGMIEHILEYRARAVVVLSGSPPNAIVAESVRRGLRVVLVNKPMRGVDADVVLSDDLAGARLAADRLVQSGARRLAVVASASFTPSQVRRMTAFRRRAAVHGCPTIVWADGSTSYETGQQAARELLGDIRPEGVFCVTDLLAMGFADVARYERGLRIPGDFGLVGFDDAAGAAWGAYRLTTIRQSVAGLTEATIAAILRPDGPTRRMVVPVELVERGSVRAAETPSLSI